MTYPFVQAFNDYGVRKGPVKAFVIHVAEGGATVAYLAKRNPNNVSVHYVIERSGRTVQMLREDHASGSLRPSAIRRNDDPGGFFGASRARAVLGDRWWRDPNSAVISLEIEGFAKKGPNEEQVRALVALIADVRSRHPGIGLLAHRDFASYKACPGQLIPWDRIGGHAVVGRGQAVPAGGGSVTGRTNSGPASVPKEDVVKAFPVYERPTVAVVKLGAWLHQYSDLRQDGGNVQLTGRTPEQLRLPYVGTFSDEVKIVAYEPLGDPDPNVSSLAMFIDADDIESIVPITAAAGTDCTPAIQAATAPLQRQLDAANARIGAAAKALNAVG